MKTDMAGGVLWLVWFFWGWGMGWEVVVCFGFFFSIKRSGRFAHIPELLETQTGVQEIKHRLNA